MSANVQGRATVCGISGVALDRFFLEPDVYEALARFGAAAEASDVSYTVEQMLRARPRNANDPEASIDFSRNDNTLTVYAPADRLSSKN